MSLVTGAPRTRIALLLPLAVLSLALAAVPARAQSCFATRDDGATVSSSADASALQAVASVALAGDTIKVAGTCTGVQATSGTTQTVRVDTAITVRGGYAPAGAGAPSWTAAPDPVANPTILDAATGGRVVYATAALTLRDLTVRNGRSTIVNENGGGIFALTDLTLQGVTVEGNQLLNASAVTGGGGVFTNGGTLTISGSTIRQNSSTSFGGGFFTWGVLAMADSAVLDNTAANTAAGGVSVGAASVAGSLFQGGRATGGTGALYLASGGSVTRTRFVDNRAAGGGAGAVFIPAGNATITDSLFSRNDSSNNGSAILATTGGSVVVLTSTIRDGVAGNAVAAIEILNGSLYVANSIIAGAETGILQSSGTAFQEYNLFFGNGADTAGTVGGGAGTLTGQDPLFVSAATDDLRLQPGSPAVDAADPASLPAGTDLAGNPRVVNGRLDMGAFEMAFATVTPSAGPNGTIAPAVPQPVIVGETATFTVTPDAGYVAFVGGTCGGTLSGTTFTTSPVTAACTVTASFVAAASACFATRDDGATVLSSADASALQAVASAAAAGDTIKVAGTCTGVQVTSGTTQTVRIGVPATIRGGYAPAVAPAGWTATPDPVANPTILDAAAGGRVVYATAALTLRDLAVRNGAWSAVNENGGGIFATTDLTLQGVTVEDNRVSNTSGSTGGGGVYTAGGTLTIADSILRQNSSSSFGGGFLAYGTLVMTDSQVVDNTSGNSAGGGLVVSPVTITGSLFSGNVAGGGSGALYAYSGGSISRSRFIANRGNGGGGGAIYIQTATATIADSLFSRNQSSLPGTALSIVTPGAVTITRTTIRDGVAGPVLAAIDADGNGAVAVTNSIVADAEEGVHTRGTTIVTQDHNLFFGNGADMVGAAGTFVGGAGTLTGLDPLFVSPGTDDLRLQLASPAIDAGDPGFASAGTDLAGNPRVFNARVDIGAYETARFTVTPTAGANGAIVPAVPQFVAPGATPAFTVTPDAGHSVAVGGTCGGTLAGNTFTTNAVAADCTVVAAFTLLTYTVTPSASANGTIAPATPQVVGHGSSAVFTVTPDAGYSVSVGGTCGGTLAGNTYTTNAITAACTVVATFAQNTYAVTPSAGANGTITPATPQTIAHGGTATFTVTPDAGYTASVGGTCGGTLAGNTYTTNAITAACTVVASFTQNTYTVTPSAGANGTITPATPQTIAHGGTLAFTVTPGLGYAPVVGGTCGGSLVGNTYTTSPITANCTVAATFTASPLNTYTGPSATGTGTITATFSGGGPACSYTVSRFIPLSGDPASPPAGTAPAATTFPHGLFDFTASACTPGSTITMTVTYPQALLTGTQYWKYGPTPSNPAPHWYVLPATITGNSVTFTITDGQLGDDDLAANGTIVDQGGPGVPGSAIAVPTLSQWAMLLLAGLVMLAGMGAVRARRG